MTLMPMPSLSPLEIAAPLVILGWIALFIGPFLGARDVERAVPVIGLGVICMAILSGLGSDATSPVFLFYLGSALMFGFWQFKMAVSERLPPAILLPCLGLTLVHAPSGLVAFAGLRLCQRLLMSGDS